MIAIIIGTSFVAFGIWGILNWFSDFLMILKGFIPLSMILGGIVAIMAGFNSIQKIRGNVKQKE